MQDKNVDFCGLLNLLAALKRAGFPKTELEQVAVLLQGGGERSRKKKISTDTLP